MANKSAKKKQEPETVTSMDVEPWIAKRTGLIIIAVVSVAMAAFVIWQLYPVIGPESILWGLGFGAGIWGVFGITYFVSMRARGKR